MAYISEIHYQDRVVDATGVSEFVEVTLSIAEYDAGLADNLMIVTYNQDGTLAESHVLSAGTAHLNTEVSPNVYQFLFKTVTSAPENSSTTIGEGIALVQFDDTGPTTTYTTLSFYDIDDGISDQGSVTATEGPAQGETSTTLLGINRFAGQQSITFDPSGAVTYGRISVPCFTKGTMISTPNGLVAIQDLNVGDLVETKDAGPQPVRWIGSRKIGLTELIAKPKLRPVVIPTDCGTPLSVSRQHRILVKGKIAERMFGQSDVLVPAKDLVGFQGVHIDDTTTSVHYFHVLLDEHHLLNANGVTAESLYLGSEGVKAMSPEARQELAEIFPDLSLDADFTPPGLCRTEQKGRRVRKMAERADKNGKALVSTF